jgi:outer membrane protein assembly factor BamB
MSCATEGFWLSRRSACDSTKRPRPIFRSQHFKIYVGVHTRVLPSVNAGKPPDEWQTYEIRLVGREVTTTLNGQKPLVVDGVLYAGTMTEVVALDAVTGRQYWKLSRPFNPDDYLTQRIYLVNKGLAIAGNTLL